MAFNSAIKNTPIFDIEVEPTAAASDNKVFGDAEPAYFYGNRFELQRYLSDCFKDIREAFVIEHPDGIKRDWFYALDNDVLEKRLKERNFIWERKINNIYKGEIKNEGQ